MGIRSWALEQPEESANELDEDEFEYFEERSAIMEYDGGLTRAHAEEEAMKEALRRKERKKSTPQN